MTSAIDFYRSEQRLVMPVIYRDVLEAELSALNFRKVKFSDNDFSKTLYFGHEDEIPWGTSVKARIRTGLLSEESLVLNLDEVYHLTIKITLDKKTETAQKITFGDVKLGAISDIILRQIGKKLDLNFLTEYKREHFVHDVQDIRVTVDYEVRFWTPNNKGFELLLKEDFIRIEVKSPPEIFDSQIIKRIVNLIMRNNGNISCSKKETGYNLIKTKASD